MCCLFKASKSIHWTDLQLDLKAVFPKLQLTTEEIQMLIFDITDKESRNHITKDQFLKCFFPEVYPGTAEPVASADDKTIRLRRTYGSITMSVSEFPSWLRTFLLEFGRAVRNLLSRFSVLKIFAALDHDKDGEINIEDLQQSIHQVCVLAFRANTRCCPPVLLCSSSSLMLLCVFVFVPAPPASVQRP